MDTATQFPNWFAMYADRFFERHLSPLAGKPGLRFLQIGAFTGDASVWMLDNVLTGEGSLLVDVDAWQGSDESAHHAMDFAEVESVYNARTAAARRVVSERPVRLWKYKGTSQKFFSGEPSVSFWPDGEPFDFIYIDGAHDAYTVLRDGVSAYEMLRVGGLLAFDDYLWTSGKGPHLDPAPAINAIGAIYHGRLELLEVGAQAWFRRSA